MTPDRHRRKTKTEEMTRMKSVLPSLLASVVLLGGIVPPSPAALQKTKDGFYVTGIGIRVKEVAWIDVEVYKATHMMREVPTPPTKRAVIQANTDKRMKLQMLRDVDLEDILEGINTGYQRNGWQDMTKVEKLFGILSEDLVEGDAFWVLYDAKKETTTAVTADGKHKASVPGKRFMMATWSTWFAKIDSPGLGDQLIQYVAPPPEPEKK
jgi:chalcone isomerase-like protein